MVREKIPAEGNKQAGPQRSLLAGAAKEETP